MDTLKPDYDDMVIGSGNGGLACAAALAAGRRWVSWAFLPRAQAQARGTMKCELFEGRLALM